MSAAPRTGRTRPGPAARAPEPDRPHARRNPRPCVSGPSPSLLDDIEQVALGQVVCSARVVQRPCGGGGGAGGGGGGGGGGGAPVSGTARAELGSSSDPALRPAPELRPRSSSTASSASSVRTTRPPMIAASSNHERPPPSSSPDSSSDRSACSSGAAASAAAPERSMTTSRRSAP